MINSIERRVQVHKSAHFVIPAGCGNSVLLGKFTMGRMSVMAAGVLLVMELTRSVEGLPLRPNRFAIDIF